MMTTKVRKKSGAADFFGSLLRKQIFIPIAALLLLAVFNLIADPSFYKISLGYNSAGSGSFRISDDDPGLWIRACDPGDRYDTGYSGIWWTGHQCGCNDRYQRQCDTTSSLWNKFKTGYSAGTDYCSVPYKLCGSNAFWSI